MSQNWAKLAKKKHLKMDQMEQIKKVRYLTQVNSLKPFFVNGQPLPQWLASVPSHFGHVEGHLRKRGASVEAPGIDPGTSRMLSERSTI